MKVDKANESSDKSNPKVYFLADMAAVNSSGKHNLHAEPNRRYNPFLFISCGLAFISGLSAFLLYKGYEFNSYKHLVRCKNDIFYVDRVATIEWSKVRSEHKEAQC